MAVFYEFKVEIWDETRTDILDTYYLPVSTSRQAVKEHSPSKNILVCLERTEADADGFNMIKGYAYFDDSGSLADYFCCGSKVPARFKR